jgi:hypothetical protein
MDAVGLLSVVLPNTQYNINQHNNTISTTEGANTVIVTLRSGVNNIAGLLSTLGTALRNNVKE